MPKEDMASLVGPTFISRFDPNLCVCVGAQRPEHAEKKKKHNKKKKKKKKLRERKWRRQPHERNNDSEVWYMIKARSVMRRR